MRGYGDAAAWVDAQARGEGKHDADKLITVTEIREIHRLAMNPVWDVAPHPDATAAEAPGGFREHDIRPFSGGMLPPSWADVSAQLTNWVDNVNVMGAAITKGELAPYDIPLALARIHNDFERIHPLLDGNVRAGRLGLNLIVVRLGFPPAMIFKRDRDGYPTGPRSGRQRRPRAPSRTDRPLGNQQCPPPRGIQHRWARAHGPTALPRRRRPELRSTATGRPSRRSRSTSSLRREIYSKIKVASPVVADLEWIASGVAI
ncbi:MAG: filamentation induced by cAMP protein Fic [Pseudonocardiales bacterium]|nr:filamentation induced by cAMP protein Fic [Pseudonocardiales bacterium]